MSNSPSKDTPKHDIAYLREWSLIYYKMHRHAREQLKANRKGWLDKHGDTADQRYSFSKLALSRDLIDQEQMYGRWSTLYATLATMEMNYEARQLFHEMKTEVNLDEE